jgi:hypothetical protein
MKKKLFAAILLAAVCTQSSCGQALRIPQNTNLTCMAGRKAGVTEIQIHCSATGVKGCERKIH